MVRQSDANTSQSGPSDSELVERFLGGDQGALGEIYQRYADRVHDLCFAMLRSPDDAADAFQDTFLVASQKLDGLRNTERLRPWLYSVARNQCHARIRSRKRTIPDADAGADVGVEIDMTTGITRDELSELMSEAKLGLSARDQEVLDLHMRHGLEGDDLAEVLDVSTESAYKLVQRVRSRVERSLGSLLVARHGRAGCPDLTELLTDWDGTFSPLMRKRVARHVDSCDLCTRRRMALFDLGGLAGALPMRPVPATLRGSVLVQILGASPPAPRHEPSWQENGFPIAGVAAGRSRKLRARSLALGLTVIVIIVVTAGALAFDQDPADEGGEQPTGEAGNVATDQAGQQDQASTTDTAAPTNTPTTSTEAPATTATTTSAPAPASTEPPTTQPPTTQAPTTLAPTTTAISSTASSTSPSTSTTIVGAPVGPSISAFRGSPTAIVQNSTLSGGPCGPGSTTSTLVVSTGTEVTRVEANWSVGTQDGPTLFVEGTGGSWTATFGPFGAGTLGRDAEDIVLTATAWADTVSSQPVELTINLSAC